MVLNIVIGLVIGLLIGFLFKSNKSKSNENLKERIETLKSQLGEQRQQHINEKERLIKEREDILLKQEQEFKNSEKLIREDAIKRSKSVMLGKMWEQIVPHYRPTDFTFIPSDARFLGSPVDFVIFKGASEGEIEEVVFLEIKTSKSRMNSQQVKMKKIIDSLSKDSKVRWETINIPIEMDKSDSDIES
jgi:predicted Holliday junction resolvase-like endonuclease